MERLATKMRFQDERIQFLNDTVFYYGSDTRRRAIEGEVWCRRSKYRTEDGRCCPVGRFIPKELHPEKLSGSLHNLQYKINEIVYPLTKPVCIEDFIPTKIYLLGLNFLEEVCALHDNDKYWQIRRGLTYSGQWAYKSIISNFCDDFIEYENQF